MLEKLIKIEGEYSKRFCNTMENEGIVKFYDNKIKDMYTHNYTLINKCKDIEQTILKEIEERRKNNEDYLRIEADFPLDDSVISNLPVTPEISTYDYMYIEADKYTVIKGNPNCAVKKAATAEVLKDGIDVDILVNGPIMGEDFATRRIHRKAEVYTQADSGLSLYVIYHNNIPIGNAELFIHDGVAKIEDFDISEEYQRKGFGTAMLKELLKQAEQAGADTVYLITDASDTAKDMYSKCGFTKLGEKTELLFFF